MACAIKGQGIALFLRCGWCLMLQRKAMGRELNAFYPRRQLLAPHKRFDCQASTVSQLAQLKTLIVLKKKKNPALLKSLLDGLSLACVVLNSKGRLNGMERNISFLFEICCLSTSLYCSLVTVWDRTAEWVLPDLTAPFHFRYKDSLTAIFPECDTCHTVRENTHPSLELRSICCLSLEVRWLSPGAVQQLQLCHRVTYEGERSMSLKKKKPKNKTSAEIPRVGFF